MKNFHPFPMYLFLITIVLGCDNPDDNIQLTNEPLIGTWKFETEQYLDIQNGDTIENNSNSDGRYFQIKSNSLLIVYWQYPDDFDESIWHKQDMDSLYLYFDGPSASVVYKYKILELNDSRMSLERAYHIWDDHIQKSIYELTRQN